MKWLALTLLVVASTSYGQGHKAPHDAHHGHHGSTVNQARVGEKVPAFTLRALDGSTVQLKDLTQGKKPALLIYWCTTCGSCRDVEKRIDAFAAAHKDKATVVMVDANKKDTPEAIKHFVEKKGLKFRVLQDEGGKLAKATGVVMTTTTLLIDAKGTLRYFGEFGHKEPYAEKALTALQAGREVDIKRGPIWG